MTPVVDGINGVPPAAPLAEKHYRVGRREELQPAAWTPFASSSTTPPSLNCRAEGVKGRTGACFATHS
jgi:hypothetical protein